MQQISKTIGLDAGHRIPDHMSKCRHLHGHRYTVTAVVQSPTVQHDGPQAGMVLDFGFLKDAMMKRIHDPYDHRCILYRGDPLLRLLFDPPIQRRGLMAQNDMGIIIVDFIPTAENLAQHWFEELNMQMAVLAGEGILPKNTCLQRVEVQETPTSVATFR